MNLQVSPYINININIFTYNTLDIRLSLLEPSKNKFLIKTLYGILFILPQGNEYNFLYKRIKHIEVIATLENKVKKEEKKK